jgi:hypothetical protein
MSWGLQPVQVSCGVNPKSENVRIFVSNSITLTLGLWVPWRFPVRYFETAQSATICLDARQVSNKPVSVDTGRLHATYEVIGLNSCCALNWQVYPFDVNRRAFIQNACCLVGCSLFSFAGQAAESLGTIVYVQKNGLWLRELPAGTPRLLISGANIQKPRFSPSGEWVSCVHANKLHVLSLQAGGAYVLGIYRDDCPPNAQWSPERDEIVLETKRGVYIFSAENLWKEAIYKVADKCFPLLFSSDGNEIVFAERSTKDKPDDAQGRICRLSLRDFQSSRSVLIAEDHTGLIPYAWNQRRGEVYYWRDTDFSGSLRSDGLELVAVSDKGGASHSLNIETLVYDDSLSLSPAQNQLVACDGGGRNTWAQKRIVLVNLETRAKRYLTSKSTAATTPCWSPVENRIVYSCGPAGEEGGGEPARRLLAQRRLWSVDSNPNGTRRQLTHDPLYRDEEPIWSANGKQILFGRISADGRKSLWIMMASGGNLRQITGTLPIYDGPEGASWRSEESWWGYYGHIDWANAFDWRQHGELSK